MRVINWSQDLCVGVEEIDVDHQSLVKYLNELFIACSAGQGPVVLKSTLQHVKDYTRTHFAHEEDVMRKIKYPDIDVHVHEHAYLISELDDLIEAFEHDPNHDLSNKTLQFLEDWLLHHILQEDKKIGKFMGAID
ncbi:bacteriohemerythrin [Magnetovibrio sp. PR-2]|uniref:bacteriohemerythrin n=1 Tax=Magnetovibrio sp. PR-2 TaxID=3120356 RepID=UPI002FCE26E6